jgi:diguanylate cyclase (GGDEF)-like protein
MRTGTATEDRQREDALERLAGGIRELTTAESVEDLSRIVRSTTQAMLKADTVRLVVYGRGGSGCGFRPDAPSRPGDGAAATGMAVGPDSADPPGLGRPPCARGMVVMPIRTTEPLGAIGAYWVSPHSPAAWERRLLQALADASAVFLANLRIRDDLETHVRARTCDLEEANRKLAREVAERRLMEEEMRRHSLTDPLTNMSNRRGFYVNADGLLRQAKRDRRRVAVLFIDVDGLKPVNDHLGHDQGDTLLRDVAWVLGSLVRDSDVLARLGGDEFVILAASDHPDRLRRRLLEAVAAFNQICHRPYRLSLSSGVAELAGHGLGDLDRALAEADRDMYADKRVRSALRSAEPLLRPAAPPGRLLGYSAGE